MSKIVITPTNFVASKWHPRGSTTCHD